MVGILFGTEIYPNQEYLLAFLPTDVARLLLGFPLLLISIRLAQRGQLIGLLFWPGILLFVLYSSIIYLFAMPLSWFFLFQLILVVSSVYTLIALVAQIDGRIIQEQLSEAIPERLAGGILIGLGVPFLLLASVVMIQSISARTTLPKTELALQIADFLITPTWIIGGVLLWRRKALGYVIGTGLFLQASMLMISLLIVILILPLLTFEVFMLTDFIAVFLFSLICIAPLTFFARAILSSQRSAEFWIRQK
jgi:hypothetical protein